MIMRVLIAEDDQISRLMLDGMLTEWGYDVTAVGDGSQAWEVLQRADAPRLAILDWIMPGMDGIEVCRKVRARPTPEPIYLLLLTARNAKADIVAGLHSGANDYVTKPFDRDELQARVQVGRTVIDLQHSLATRVRELEAALSQVKQLQGLLPLCSYCRKVRDDHHYWQQVEGYLVEHSELRFSHSICPACWESQVGPQLAQYNLGDPRQKEHPGG